MKTKNYFLQICFVVITFFFASSAFAQNQVRITLHQPPPNQLSAKDLWKMTLENTTGSPIEIYLEGYGEEQTEGRIVDGRSPAFTLPPGSSNYNYESFKSGSVSWKNSRYEEFIVRTGQVPAGTYITCVTAYSTEGAILGMEKCITQVISRGFEGEITLISPEDGEEISDDNPNFVWMLSRPPKTQEGTITIMRMVQIIGNQSPQDAITKNKAVFEQSGIRTTNIRYPTSAPKLEEGKKYAWIVIAGDLQSEIGTFTVKDPQMLKLAIFIGDPMYNCSSGEGVCRFGDIIRTEKYTENTEIYAGRLEKVNEEVIRLIIDRNLDISPVAYKRIIRNNKFIMGGDFEINNSILSILGIEKRFIIGKGEYDIVESNNITSIDFKNYPGFCDSTIVTLNPIAGQGCCFEVNVHTNSMSVGFFNWIQITSPNSIFSSATGLNNWNSNFTPTNVNWTNGNPPYSNNFIVGNLCFNPGSLPANMTYILSTNGGATFNCEGKLSVKGNCDPDTPSDKCLDLIRIDTIRCIGENTIGGNNYSFNLLINNPGLPVSSSLITSSCGTLSGLPAMIPSGINSFGITLSTTSTNVSYCCISFSSAICRDSLCFDLPQCPATETCEMEAFIDRVRCGQTPGTYEFNLNIFSGNMSGSVTSFSAGWNPISGTNITPGTNVIQGVFYNPDNLPAGSTVCIIGNVFTFSPSFDTCEFTACFILPDCISDTTSDACLDLIRMDTIRCIGENTIGGNNYSFNLLINNPGLPVSSSLITSSCGTLSGLPPMIPPGTNLFGITLSTTSTNVSYCCISFSSAVCRDSLCFDLPQCSDTGTCEIEAFIDSVRCDSVINWNNQQIQTYNFVLHLNSFSNGMLVIPNTTGNTWTTSSTAIGVGNNTIYGTYLNTQNSPAGSQICLTGGVMGFNPDTCWFTFCFTAPSCPTTPDTCCSLMLDPNQLHGDTLCPGQSVTINWNGCTPNNLLNISLIDGTNWVVYQSVASGIPTNSGSYTWTLPANIPCDTIRKWQFYIEDVNKVCWNYGPEFYIKCCKVSPWQQFNQPKLLESDDDDINMSLNTARTRLANTEVGRRIENWYGMLNTTNWAEKILETESNLDLAKELIEVGKRVVVAGGRLRKDDIPVIEKSLLMIERAGLPAPGNLIEAVINVIRASENLTWDEIINNISEIKER
jgi:hypothetical protein